MTMYTTIVNNEYTMTAADVLAAIAAAARAGYDFRASDLTAAHTLADGSVEYEFAAEDGERVYIPAN